MTTNNAPAESSSKAKQTTLQFVEKVQVYKARPLEDLLDYSVLVSNNISMARDQLANERNWLTWFRLSCTLIILGKCNDRIDVWTHTINTLMQS